MLPNYDTVTSVRGSRSTPSCTKYYYKEKLHRIDGPAINTMYSSKYFLFGNEVKYNDFQAVKRQYLIEFNLRNLNL